MDASDDDAKINTETKVNRDLKAFTVKPLTLPQAEALLKVVFPEDNDTDTVISFKD